jgi:hypothetical protein
MSERFDIACHLGGFGLGVGGFQAAGGFFAQIVLQLLAGVLRLRQHYFAADRGFDDGFSGMAGNRHNQQNANNNTENQRANARGHPALRDKSD